MSTVWTQKDIDNLKKKGFQVKDVEKPKGTPIIPKPEPAGLDFIKHILKKRNIAFITEFKFCTTRKFRADIAIPQYRILIEYEGLVYGGQGGHQTVEGFNSNCIKYNICTLQGWFLLRYTNQIYKNFDQDITEFLLNIK